MKNQKHSKKLQNDINIVTSDNFVEIMESLLNRNYGRLMNELDVLGILRVITAFGINDLILIITITVLLLFSNDVIEIFFIYNGRNY